MQGSQVLHYLSFDGRKGRKERGRKVYFYEEKNIYYPLIQFFFSFFLILGWAILFFFLLTSEISFSSILQVFLKMEIRRMVNLSCIQNQNTYLT